MIDIFNKSKLNKAFTLSEILITLGIIGVVAAMTLPILIQSYKKHIIETRLQKFYNVMNNAIMRAENEYGDRKIWYSNYDGFSESKNLEQFLNTYLIPYLNIVKIKKSAALPIVIYFNDGSAYVFFSSKLGAFYPNGTDKCSKSKENTGKCMFYFYWLPNNEFYYDFGPYSYKYPKTTKNMSLDTLKNNSSYGCNTTSNSNRYYCTKLIQNNGWKVPKDYPIKF